VLHTDTKRAKTETGCNQEEVEEETADNQTIYKWVKANGFSFDYLIRLTITRQPGLETTYLRTCSRWLTVRLGEKDVYISSS